MYFFVYYTPSNRGTNLTLCNKHLLVKLLFFFVQVLLVFYVIRMMIDSAYTYYVYFFSILEM